MEQYDFAIFLTLNSEKISRNREREKKTKPTTSAIVQYAHLVSLSRRRNKKKKSEIEITFLNSHFVNLRRGEQASTNSNRALNEEERNRVRTASE